MRNPPVFVRELDVDVRNSLHNIKLGRGVTVCLASEFVRKSVEGEYVESDS